MEVQSKCCVTFYCTDGNFVLYVELPGKPMPGREIVILGERFVPTQFGGLYFPAPDRTSDKTVAEEMAKHIEGGVGNTPDVHLMSWHTTPEADNATCRCGRAYEDGVEVPPE